MLNFVKTGLKRVFYTIRPPFHLFINTLFFKETQRFFKVSKAKNTQKHTLETPEDIENIASFTKKRRNILYSEILILNLEIKDLSTEVASKKKK